MNILVKWLSRILGVIIGAVTIVLLSAYVVTGIRGSNVYSVSTGNLPTITADPQSVERGRHLVHAIAKCADCHADDFGGKVIVDDALIGKITGPNITTGTGSVVAGFTDEDFVRSLRYGIHRDGTPLLLMPCGDYWYHDDKEIADIISYIRNLPPVDRLSVTSSVGPMMRVLNLFGKVDLFPAATIEPDKKRPPVPAEAPTKQYGRHLALVGGCIGCHGPELSGGPIPGAPPDWPPATNLTPDPVSGIGRWTEADFIKSLRSGLSASGRQLDPNSMPWKATAQMTDVEIRALYLFLLSQPSRPVGNR